MTGVGGEEGKKDEKVLALDDSDYKSSSISRKQISERMCTKIGIQLAQNYDTVFNPWVHRQ